MDKVVIGIHGLRNKPPKEQLALWWKESINEGFRVINLPVLDFNFEMAYWSHYLYPEPEDLNIKDTNHPLYLDEPYVPGKVFGPREHVSFSKNLLDNIQKQLLQIVAGKSGYLNTERVTDIILHQMFKELDVYYHHNLIDKSGKEKPAKELIRGELAELIYKNRNKNILLIAHSMGSIIAYDVLMHTLPDIPIHSLITIGSPLGFPVVLKKIKQELGINPINESKLPTPENIKHHWYNFSDQEDVTCLNYNLRNNYKENSSKVRPFDGIVFNNYEFNGKLNPHKIYGYLRDSELTNVVYNFLALEDAGFWQRLKWLFKGFKGV